MEKRGTNHIQDEAEWIVKTHHLTGCKTVICSNCGRKEFKGPAWDLSWGDNAFCPNCGKKMRNGYATKWRADNEQREAD